MSTVPQFFSSGDILADRRFEWARESLARGEIDAAIELLSQAIERAPNFASAWFLLGDLHEQQGDLVNAGDAFLSAVNADPDDRLGAALRAARLSSEGDLPSMPRAYVRALFDQYASRFDAALVENLEYTAPSLLLAAMQEVCENTGRPAKFNAVLDLGCGTGLAGKAFRPHTARLVGVDLSPGMLEQARAKRIYDRLEAADLLDFLAAETEMTAHYDLIVAADVFVYIPDLEPIVRAMKPVMTPGGFLAFTLETHSGDSVILRETLRYAHAASYVRAVLEKTGLTVVGIAERSTRTEKGVPVPGLVVVARRI